MFDWETVNREVRSATSAFKSISITTLTSFVKKKEHPTNCLSKAGQSLETPVGTGWRQPEAKPCCSTWRALGPTSHQSPFKLSVPALHLPRHPCLWHHKMPLEAEFGPSHHQPLSFPHPGETRHTSIMKLASPESPWSKHGHVSPLPSGRHEIWWESPILKAHTTCTTETRSCEPSYSTTTLQRGEWLLASTVTPFLPKSSCSVFPLQRAVVYFGTLFLFCKYFVFV